MMLNSTIMVNDLRLALRIVRSRCLTWWVRGNELLVDILSKGVCHFSIPCFGLIGFHEKN